MIADPGRPAVPRRIVGFATDAEGHWVAELECGHGQHVRHDPPWQQRPWVTTPDGRATRLGTELRCVRCAEPACRPLHPSTADPVSLDANKALVRRYLSEVWNAGAPAAPFFAAGYRRYRAPDAPPLDGAGQAARIAAFRAAFPDLVFTVEDIIAEGDRVVFRATLRGTHRGPFLGIAPTGRSVAINVLDVVRVADGAFVEHWGGPDLVDTLADLRAAPPADAEGGAL